MEKELEAWSAKGLEAEAEGGGKGGGRGERLGERGGGLDWEGEGKRGEKEEEPPLRWRVGETGRGAGGKA